jgi:hypothetical protein
MAQSLELKMRCTQIVELAQEEANPIYAQKLAELAAGGKGEAEAKAQLESEGIHERIENVLAVATLEQEGTSNKVEVEAEPSVLLAGAIYGVSFTEIANPPKPQPPAVT